MQLHYQSCRSVHYCIYCGQQQGQVSQCQSHPSDSASLSLWREAVSKPGAASTSRAMFIAVLCTQQQASCLMSSTTSLRVQRIALMVERALVCCCTFCCEGHVVCFVMKILLHILAMETQLIESISAMLWVRLCFTFVPLLYEPHLGMPQVGK